MTFTLIEWSSSDGQYFHLLVGNTHMQAGGSDSLKQSQIDEAAEVFREAMQDIDSSLYDRLVILALGDFNVAERNENSTDATSMYSYLLSTLSDSTIDIYRSINGNSPTGATSRGFPRRIDYVFGIEIINGQQVDSIEALEADIDAFVETGDLSDHLGPYATVRLESDTDKYEEPSSARYLHSFSLFHISFLALTLVIMTH